MGATDMELGGDMAADMEDDISADMDMTGGDEASAGPVDEPLRSCKKRLINENKFTSKRK